MKDLLNKTINYFNIFAKVLKLIWMSSHKFAISFIITNIILGIFSPLLLIVWKYFIDAVTNAIALKDSSYISRAIIVLIIHGIIIVAMNFTNQLSAYCQEMQRDYLNKYILEITMKKISELELSQFDSSDIYDNIEKVNNESTQRTVSMLELTMTLIRSFTSLGGVIIILLRINCLFVILCFLSCIPMFIVSTKVSIKKYSLFNERMERMRLVYNLKYLISKYENVKEIKLFRLGKYIKNMAIDVYDKNLKEDRAVRKKYLGDISITDIIQNTLSYAFKLYILQVVLFSNIYTLGDLTMFISAIENFQSLVRNLLNTVSGLYVDGLYLQNLFSLMNIEVIERGEQEFQEDFKEIVFEDVWFKYPNTSKYVLKGINCTFKAGKSYCIVGLNGSGKTTLVKLLTKLYEPSKGRILIDGVDLNKIDADSYYKSIGVIFQDFIKYPFNVLQNIGVGKVEEIDNVQHIFDAAKKANADDFINKLAYGYKTYLQKEWSEGTELSIGQWQKIAISRAYMAESSLIILDEPTASLDVEAEYAIYEQFEKLMSGKLCVLISHRLSTNKLVDGIFFLEDGKIKEAGSHAELLKRNGNYAVYYNLQANTYKN